MPCSSFRVPRKSASCFAFPLAVAVDATVARADEADDQFAVAAGHYDRQRWKLAVDEFQAFVQSIPTIAGRTSASSFSARPFGSWASRRGRPHFQEYARREPDGKYGERRVVRLGESAYLAGNFAAAKPDWPLSGKISGRSAERLRVALPGRHCLAGSDVRRRPAISATD